MSAYALWGGYGGHNLGDEAILWALCHLISKFKPDAKLYVLIRGHIDDKVIARYKEWQLETVRFPSLRAIHLLREATVVAGGGQMVDDKSLGYPVFWTSVVLLVNRILGRRPLLMGIGAEPVKHPFTKFFLKYCYSLACVCNCRDSESAAVLEAVGVDPSRITISRDLVFSLYNPAAWQPRRNQERPLKVALIVKYDPNRNQGNNTDFSALTRSLLRVGFDVHLIAHDLRVEYDQGHLNQLASEFSDEPKVVCHSVRETQGLMHIYSFVHAVISNRMHPLILAALVKSIPIAIMGTPKVNALVANLGMRSLNDRASYDAQGAAVAEYILSNNDYSMAIASRLTEFKAMVEQSSQAALSLN